MSDPGNPLSLVLQYGNPACPPHAAHGTGPLVMDCGFDAAALGEYSE